MRRTALFENKDYLTKQIITYIDNKRSLLAFIAKGISIVQKKLQKEKLNLFDVFSGTGIVSRFFKQYAEILLVNDLEALSDLVENIKAKYVLISVNSEGFIPLDTMKSLLKKVGKVSVLETNYNTFRG